MSLNRFGNRLVVSTWGESHGCGIGCVIDGCPANIPLDENDIQTYLERRRSGLSRHTSQRREPDKVKIQSGVYNGMTLGSPIHLFIPNIDNRPKDYANITNTFRPGHADLTYMLKYGHRDPRGGGRSSARETAMRVAAGAVALKLLHHRLGSRPLIRAAVSELGPHPCNSDNWDWDEVQRNPLFCPDKTILPVWEKYLDDLRRQGNSCGAIITLNCDGIPAGLGEPVYGKMDAELAGAMMSINAAKAIEIGDGFNIARATGLDVVDSPLPIADDDPIRDSDPSWSNLAANRTITFRANHNGGIWGGITTGQPLVLRVAFKPTSSLRSDIATIDTDLRAATISTRGRHDPCVGIRAVPIVEAMATLVIADQYLRQQSCKD